MTGYFNPSNPHRHPATSAQNDISRIGLAPCGSCRHVPAYQYLDVPISPVDDFNDPLNELGPAQFVLVRNLPTFRQFERRPGFKYYDHPKLAHEGPTDPAVGCEWISPEFIIDNDDHLEQGEPSNIVVDKSEFSGFPTNDLLSWRLSFDGAEASGKWGIQLETATGNLLSTWRSASGEDVETTLSRRIISSAGNSTLQIQPSAGDPESDNPFKVHQRVVAFQSPELPPDPLLETSFGGDPVELLVAEVYSIVFISGNTIKLSLTRGGDPIVLTESKHFTIQKLKNRARFNCLGVNQFFFQQVLTVTPFYP